MQKILDFNYTTILHYYISDFLTFQQNKLYLKNTVNNNINAFYLEFKSYHKLNITNYQNLIEVDHYKQKIEILNKNNLMHLYNSISQEQVIMSIFDLDETIHEQINNVYENDNNDGDVNTVDNNSNDINNDDNNHNDPIYEQDSIVYGDDNSTDINDDDDNYNDIQTVINAFSMESIINAIRSTPIHDITDHKRYDDNDNINDTTQHFDKTNPLHCMCNKCNENNEVYLSNSFINMETSLINLCNFSLFLFFDDTFINNKKTVLVEYLKNNCVQNKNYTKKKECVICLSEIQNTTEDQIFRFTCCKQIVHVQCFITFIKTFDNDFKFRCIYCRNVEFI